MLLEGKNAIVYGAGGLVGGAVARAFAEEGAEVFLAGRNLAPLEAVADRIRASGGRAQTASVDALDESAVDAHVEAIVEQVGRIDVSFNAIGRGDVHGQTLSEMPFEDFCRPVLTAIKGHYFIARAAARHMVKQRAGVILTITATTARHSIPEVGGTGVAFEAVESLCRQWACELGPHGVRVAWLRTTGLPEALHADVFPAYGTGSGPMNREQLVSWLEGKTMMNRLTSLAEVGQAAAFVASDRAGAMTGGSINLTRGSVTD